MRDLNDIMEFDHVVTVHEDGTVTDGPDDVYAPEFHDGELTDPKWTEFSHGYTGQYGVASPMHNSEFIGGLLADDIRETPGTYVAVVCYWSCDDECERDEYGECREDHAEGWAVMRLKD